MPTLPLLMLVGIVGIACSVAGVWWSQSRLPAAAIAAEATSSVGRMKEKSRWAADAAAGPGVILAITAVASVIFFSVGATLARSGRTKSRGRELGTPSGRAGCFLDACRDS